MEMVDVLFAAKVLSGAQDFKDMSAEDMFHKYNDFYDDLINTEANWHNR